MWNQIKIGFCIAIPIILYFLVAMVKSRLQKERILDLARSYVREETKLKKKRIQDLEVEYNKNEEKIRDLEDSIATRKLKLAQKYKYEAQSDKDIIDLFGEI